MGSWCVEVQVEMIALGHWNAVVQRDMPQILHLPFQLTPVGRTVAIPDADVGVRSKAVVRVWQFPRRPTGLLSDVEQSAVLQTDVVDADGLMNPIADTVGEYLKGMQRGWRPVVIVHVTAL